MKKVRYGRGYGSHCAICGRGCKTWQECVVFQKQRPISDPKDYVIIYDTAKPFTPEQVAEREADFRNRFPYMTDSEVVLASILEAGSHVSAKCGGSAGSGLFSKHVMNCKSHARKRGIILDSHDNIIAVDTDEDDDEERSF